MNRRQFTVSLGSLTGAAALPFPSIPPMATTVPAVPSSTYSWAQLIARAQPKTTATSLARQLGLSPEGAQNVFHALVRNGVLGQPSAAGIAAASRPLQTTGHSATAPQAARARISKLLEQPNPTPNDIDPLVNANDPALLCGETSEKEVADASPSEHIQESPSAG